MYKSSEEKLINHQIEQNASVWDIITTFRFCNYCHHTSNTEIWSRLECIKTNTRSWKVKRPIQWRTYQGTVIKSEQFKSYVSNSYTCSISLPIISNICFLIRACVVLSLQLCIYIINIQSVAKHCPELLMLQLVLSMPCSARLKIAPFYQDKRDESWCTESQQAADISMD